MQSKTLKSRYSQPFRSVCLSAISTLALLASATSVMAQTQTQGDVELYTPAPENGIIKAINDTPATTGQNYDFVPLRDLGQNETSLAPPPATAPSSPVPSAPIEEAGLPLPISPNQFGPAVAQPSIGQNALDIPIHSLPSISDLVAKVSPSVVNIIVTTETGETTSEGRGSGFVISDKLEVVTNYHVIDGGTYIDIEFNDGRKYSATIIGTDEETDLALLKIETNDRIPHVNFHQGKKVRIGDWVVAIGNPFGIGQSTSMGVISAIGRERVDSGSYVDYIQTDATINRGNSGGPLFNLNGDVVGVNSAIYSPTGASVGIAFVIPHGTAEDIIESIRRDGRVRRGYLGAGLRTATFEETGRPGVFKAGATVNNVLPGSPAEAYGLQVDDIILRINDAPTRNSVEATRAIAALSPGDVAKFIYERNEKTYALDVSIGERPEKYDIERSSAIAQGLPPPPPPPDPSQPQVNIDTGLHILDLSAEFRSAIGMRSDQVGVYVESTDPNSNADQAGFKTGMVLLEADSQPIVEVAKFKSIVLNARLENQDSLVILVRLKDGQETLMVLPL
ncbi:MAG: trypsin-like peptidase domain-containing protein [Litorimonas sp.]